MNAVITGIGWVTATAAGCAGDFKDFAMPEKPLPDITSRAIFGPLYPYARRMDAYSKSGLAAVAFALKDADQDQWTEKRNIGIIAATETGCLKTDLDYFETVKPSKDFQPSPALFSYTLPNTYLGEAAIRFGLTGPNFVIHEQAPLGLSALKLAMESLELGEAEKMLCGFCSLAVPAPFDAIRKGPPGAVFFLLEKLPEDTASVYGPVRLDRKNRIFFNRTQIEDLAVLVQIAMASRRARQRKT
ncbi:MAG: beta-ketoacyl synthase N-terminal-like domain-containing protein [Thermodesulfobacteriota bacterium]